MDTLRETATSYRGEGTLWVACSTVAALILAPPIVAACLSSIKSAGKLTRLKEEPTARAGAFYFDRFRGKVCAKRYQVVRGSACRPRRYFFSVDFQFTITLYGANARP